MQSGFRASFPPRSSSSRKLSAQSLLKIKRFRDHSAPCFRPLHSQPTMSNTRIPQPGDFDTSHSTTLRKFKRTHGLLPPHVESSDIQLQRCLNQLASKTRNIDKYLYLSGLRNNNVHLFYRLLVDHIKAIAPLIYTPTVGEACKQWSHNYVQPEGLYLTPIREGLARSCTIGRSQMLK